MPINESPFEETSISIAWGKAFLKVMAPGTNEVKPLIISIRGLSSGAAKENAGIRGRLDKELSRTRYADCHTVANTLFPQALFDGKRARSTHPIYARYLTIWPLIKRHQANKRGVYFHRMIAFNPKVSRGAPINQLDHIIKTYRGGNHRRSALQAAVFDPTRDHSNSRQQGFPCMQQIAFSPSGGRLSVTAFYATQYLFERAYGNLLGLCRLGTFMALQMGLKLDQVNCVSAVGQRGKPSKTRLTKLAKDLRKLIRQ